ncbi:helix-turn-helix transcriptional regulator [Natronolimnobius sp. AArcel1]|uniref:winged helix-turn-helix domain-containing protein n=1 Tax=Natronolimnobius sp. AArcel1 TaxID=1679093 RepID=UPI0013ECD279|nr:helix-turn-helix domain-containing protein [Natronolimnobius sp. AArcel1]NGM70733.1 helix-turn-helix transcriptional regulator [Natronolimnobius sp. AArcel1]
MTDDLSVSLPDDAFGVLSHDLRLAVLDVLQRAQKADTFAAEPVAYAELAMLVSERLEKDFTRDSGNFNYHLRTLRDAGFIRRVDGGYRIRQAGVRVVRAVRAGNISNETQFESVPINEPCPYCNAESTISLDDDWLFIRCSSCDGAFAQDETLPSGTLAGFEVSPASVQGRDPIETFKVAFQLGQQVHRSFAAGICPECGGTTTTEILETCLEHELTEEHVCDACGRTTDEFVAVSCDVCNRSLMTFPAIVVATDPHVIATMYERGRDVTDQTWGALSRPPDWPCHHVQTEPPILEYVIPVPDGEDIRVQLDMSLTVRIINP